MQQHDGGRILAPRLAIKDFPTAYRRVFIGCHASPFEAFHGRACLADLFRGVRLHDPNL
jgi:hypothetical protein